MEKYGIDFILYTRRLLVPSFLMPTLILTGGIYRRRPMKPKSRPILSFSVFSKGDNNHWSKVLKAKEIQAMSSKELQKESQLG